MALSDVTANDTNDDPQDGLIYVPPRSSSYRTSLYPGFFSPGAGPSANPNPVSGSDPVAAPSVGEFGYTAPAAPAAQGLSSITSNPVGQDPGDSADERAANRAKDVKDAGLVTDPMDFAKALNIGSSIISPTGLAGLAVSTGLAAAGLNPLGNPWDLKSNINQKPGYSAAYDAAIANGASPQAALNAARTKVEDIEAVPARFRGYAQGVPAPTPTPTPVTQANSATGFGAQGANPNPNGVPTIAAATPAATVVSAPPAASPGAGNSNAGIAAHAIDNGGFSTKGSFGVDAPGNGGGSGKGNANGGRADPSRGGEMGGHGSSYNKGGVVMKPHHKDVAKKNHTVMNALAAKTGKTTGEIAVKHKDSKGQLGAMSRLQMHVAHMAMGGKVRHYATGGEVAEGDPESMYNPPAESTMGDGDTEPAMLTPGEMVITKDAAEQYDPDVLAALNDPEQAQQINDLIEQFLNDDAEEADDETAPDTNESDDSSGLGVMKDVGSKPSVFMRPKTGLAGVTRA